MNADAEYIGFIPCRSGSERVPNKNTRPFAGFKNGLLELKLKQMAEVSELSRIVVSSDDPQVLDIAADLRVKLDGRIDPMDRPKSLALSSTTMDDFIHYIANLCDCGTIVWTHVTSPLLRSEHYSESIKAYEKSLDVGHDSLISVTKLQKFIWNAKGPVNYDPAVLKWPRSQDLDPLFEINHGAYIMPFGLMRDVGDRIGRKPYFHEFEESDAMDIDWAPQFDLLETIVKQKISSGAPYV